MGLVTLLHKKKRGPANFSVRSEGYQASSFERKGEKGRTESLLELTIGAKKQRQKPTTTTTKKTPLYLLSLGGTLINFQYLVVEIMEEKRRSHSTSRKVL